MKRKKLLAGLFSVLGVATMGNSLFAQQNLGASCGCPDVATRTSQSITTASGGTWVNLPAAAYGKELTSGSITLTCNKVWTLDEKVYIGPGATITIEPGTVIRGALPASAAAATALIIERGGKIIAPGTEDCPIVFTAALDLLDGEYSVNNKGKWGGVLICGKAENNLKFNNNGPFTPGSANGKLAVADGLGVLEGFASSYPQDQYGVALSTPTNFALATYPAGVLGADNDYSFNLTAGSSVLDASTSLYSNVASQKKITLSSNAPIYVSTGQLVLQGTTELGRIASINGSTITLQSNIPAGVTAFSALSLTFKGDYPGTGSYYFPTTATAPVPGAPTGVAPVQGPTNPSGQGYVNFAGTPIPSGLTPDNNDNSGVMTYVSIRHAGANLLVGSEINGLTLASVGRGTKIEHIEIVSCADDNIELFGGTVDLKYCTTLFGNDDMYDYDQGWSGRAQFLFGMKSDLASGISPDNDNGFECDSDDGKSYNQPHSVPRIYNATIIGNAKTTSLTDNSGMAAIWAKEFTGGEFYNSIFSNFRIGVNFATTTEPSASAGSRGLNFGGDAWHNYLPASSAISATSGNGSERLKIKCNTFVGNTNGVTLGAGAGTVTASMILAAGNVGYDKFVGADNNIIIANATGIPGFNPAFAITTANVVTTPNDVVPNPALPLNIGSGTGCSQAPSDGFFEPANFRGAFSSTAGDNWLSDWSYSELLGSTLGVTACPTDLNGDGTTDVQDFLIFGPAFGTSCN